MRVFTVPVGKPVIACLTKVKPENAAATVKHFEKEVLAELRWLLS